MATQAGRGAAVGQSGGSGLPLEKPTYTRLGQMRKGAIKDEFRAGPSPFSAPTGNGRDYLTPSLDHAVVLVVAFGALTAAGLPLLPALSAVMAALGVVGAFSHVVPVSEAGRRVALVKAPGPIEDLLEIVHVSEMATVGDPAALGFPDQGGHNQHGSTDRRRVSSKLGDRPFQRPQCIRPEANEGHQERLAAPDQLDEDEAGDEVHDVVLA